MYCMCSNYKVDLLILSTLIYSFTWLFQYCYYSIYSINSTKVKGAVLYYSSFSSTGFLSVSTPCSMLLLVVACCCSKFETGQTFSYVQTGATTPNNVGPTMLGVLEVVASACT